MRAWWRRQTPEHRRRLIEGRDPEKTREQDRRKMARRRAAGTDEQRLRIAARGAVHRAKQRGDLIPAPCESCGATEVHAHHPDYTRALDVRWLCRPCHEALHAAQREAA